MSQAFLLTVRSVTGTFHGTADRGSAEWPPSPFRLFQALVAGAHGGRWIEDDPDRTAAFTWLEAQDPPVIFAPRAEKRKSLKLYVPNNDMDTPKVSGDPQRVGEIRAPKILRPQTFDAELPIHYLWTDVSDDAPPSILGYVRRLHTLGLGVDPAFADASFLNDAAIASFRPDPRLVRHQPGGSGHVRVPSPGSYTSLADRHEAFGGRLLAEGKGRKARTAFRQPPKARYGSVGYEKPPHRLFFTLRRSDAPERPQAVPATRAVRLVEAVRDRIAAVFAGSPLVDRLVTGRSAGPDDIVDRLRIIPLPSIGHEHADRLIRRLLVDIPQTSPLRPEAINWALEGQELSLSANGPKVLIAGSAEDAVTQRYLAQSSRYWRSVTPIALFRRDKKSLIQALRQAGLDAQLDKATLRREPLTKKGRYSTDYVHGTRFGPERTVHATLRFNMPIYGPVLIGDGRFLGLGLFEPFEPGADDCWAFAFDKALPLSAHVEVARQFRRALMARVQAQLGGKELPPVISGHEPDGRPLRGGVHRHLFYRAMVEDGELRGIEVMAPHLVAGGGTAAAWTNHKGCIDEALASFSNLHYGGANVELAPATSDRPSASLRLASVTRYVTTRRPRLADDRTEFLKADIKNEAFRCNLKLAGEPQMSGPKLEATGRLSAHVELRLIEGCKYHVMLGASSHYAGGAFEGCE